MGFSTRPCRSLSRVGKLPKDSDSARGLELGRPCLSHLLTRGFARVTSRSSRFLLREKGHCGTCLVGLPGPCQLNELPSSREPTASQLLWLERCGDVAGTPGGRWATTLHRTRRSGRQSGSQSDLLPQGRPEEEHGIWPAHMIGLVRTGFLEE